MKTIRVYLSVYPWWYKLVTLFLCPVVYLILTISLLRLEETPAAQFAAITIWGSHMGLLAMVEITTDFYSVGALYKKKEPFGRYLLTSKHAQQYYRKFIVGDLLRRSLYCIIYALPAAVMNTTLGVLTGFTTLAVFLCFTWIQRHVQSPFLITVIGIGAGSLSAALPLIAMLSGLVSLKWTLTGVSLVVIVIFIRLSMLSAKITMEDSCEK